MLDYHVHLWPHTDRADETDLVVERLAEYCSRAAAAGVREIALTEHFHRFRRGREVVDGFWADEPDLELRQDMAEYFDFHATVDLDAYVEVVLAAKQAGLPIVAGLEVDYCRGQMDLVSSLLAGYPFDVLLGSIHWIGNWMFDVLDSPLQMRQWEVRGVDAVWHDYALAMEELAATRTCDVLAHPDVVRVTGRTADPGVVTEVEARIAEAAATSGMAAEVSSAGFRKPVADGYPSRRLLDRFAALGVPITTASDTHGLSHVADRAAVLHERVSRAGYTSLRAYRGRQGLDAPLGPPPGSGVKPGDSSDSKSRVQASSGSPGLA
ncbi:MAG: histidinol-phosphatase [Acidimicrobiales bacterium]